MKYSWEPCIMKHGPHYDDPWRYNGSTKHDRKACDKPILVYDKNNGHITEWASRQAFSDSERVAVSTISNGMSTKRLVFGRYVFGTTIDQLFRNMRVHGLQ